MATPILIRKPFIICLSNMHCSFRQYEKIYSSKRTTAKKTFVLMTSVEVNQHLIPHSSVYGDPCSLIICNEADDNTAKAFTVQLKHQST